MEIYLIFVIILFVLAISDLIVGVVNDAVNFTNSAIGSQAAPRWVIMLVASAGIFVGTTFSGGMMEVARKGVFNPEMFLLMEVMVIFLAVMFTDVMLLDLYNTFGLPTSTTVSLVFELMGASVAVALIKITAAGDPLSQLAAYINSDRALAMVSSILLSVVLAFLLGTLVQFLTRILFTFDYRPALRRYGAAWCAVAITFIIYYILVKGVKGSVLLSAETQQWIQANGGLINLLSIVGWLIVFQVLIWTTRINILKIIVLVGTFALALSFAANDLVNFIGVAMAGLASYQLAQGAGDLSTLTMEGLQQPVELNPLILLGASAVMIITLWSSKKARKVTRTEVDLARQEGGSERFASSAMALAIVKTGVTLFETLSKMVPAFWRRWIAQRMDMRSFQTEKDTAGNTAAFDMLRAAVNLMVASSLISVGTSLKLPLSTTYVTFMVAMGTSLADKAWGRETAPSRVNGVLTVIGGWFFTALIAFTVSAVLALVIYFGGLLSVGILLLLAVFWAYRTHNPRGNQAN